MKLYEMNLKEVLEGLNIINGKYENVVIGNDEDKTLYIKNITIEQYNNLKEFNISNLNNNINTLSILDIKSIDIINNYILPKLNKRKERFYKYGF